MECGCVSLSAGHGGLELWEAFDTANGDDLPADVNRRRLDGGRRGQESGRTRIAVASARNSQPHLIIRARVAASAALCGLRTTRLRQPRLTWGFPGSPGRMQGVAARRDVVGLQPASHMREPILRSDAVGTAETCGGCHRVAGECNLDWLPHLSSPTRWKKLWHRGSDMGPCCDLLMICSPRFSA